MKNKTISQLSGALLMAVKMEHDVEALIKSLAIYDFDTLLQELTDDNLKKAFWINIYNAFYLILKTHQKIEKNIIYSEKAVIIATKKFSLDDIEHGILRRYRSKYSLGYLPKLFVAKIIKILAVEVIDYRIHFALNCGAKSCPPIAFYNPDRLDSQLDMASQSFIEGETVIDDDLKVISTTSLFLWYKSDFKGFANIKSIISKVFKQDLSNYSLKFAKYNWDEDLFNFRDKEN